MPDSLPNTSENVLLMIGEVRGQIRELVHSLGDMRQVINAVNAKLDTVAVTASHVEQLTQRQAASEIEINAKIQAIDIRLTAVERIEHQRTGALKLSEFVLKAVPWAAAGSFFAIALAITAKAIGLDLGG